MAKSDQWSYILEFPTPSPAPISLLDEEFDGMAYDPIWDTMYVDEDL